MITRLAQHLPILSAVLITTAGLAIVWQVTLGFRAFTWESYRRLQVTLNPVPVPDITLQDHNGDRLRLANNADRWLLINFIYTRCPTVCKAAGTIHARLLEAIRQHGWANRVRLISISLEPGYDTPQRLNQYRQRYHNRPGELWQAARTRNVETQQLLLETFGVVSIPDPWGGIQHNVALHLVNPEGQLIEIMDDTAVTPILTRLQRRLDRSETAYVALAP